MPFRSYTGVFLAIVLCFWPLSWPLWPDESFASGVLVRDAAGIIKSAANDRHPPLYYLYAAAFRGLGTTDWALRLPSALAAIVAVALVVWSVKRHFDEDLAMKAGLWMAMAPVLVVFAHTVRMYALLACWGSVLMVGLLEVTQPKGKYGLGITLLFLGGSAALYTHYAGAGMVAAVFVGAFWALKSEGKKLIGVIGAALGVGAVFAPWGLGPFQAQLADRADVVHRNWPALLYLFSSSGPGVSPWLWLGLPLSLVGMWAWARRMPWVGGAWAVALVFPLVVSASAPAQNPRNYIAFLPLQAITLAMGTKFLSERLARVGPWIEYAPIMFLSFPLLSLLMQPQSPQDLGHGRDYRLEAQVFDSVVPKEATLRFEPAYVQGHYSRYAPALRERTGGQGNYVAQVVGAKNQGCVFTQAFRAQLSAPADACDRIEATLRQQAEATGYAPFWTELALRSLNKKDLDQAQSDIEKALVQPRGFISSAEIASRIAQARGEWDLALGYADQALSLARQEDYPGKTIGRMWDDRAKILEKLSRSEDASTAKSAATCARDRSPAWVCGTPLSWATVGALAADDTVEAPKDPPDRAGGSTERGDWRDVTVRSLPQRWDFEESSWPKGWIRTGVAKIEDGKLSVGDSKAEIDVACTPILSASTPILIQLHWAADILGMDPPTWSVVEVRAVDEQGRSLTNLDATRFFATRQPHGLMTEQATWQPPASASLARVCIKTGGAAAGASIVDWMEVSGGSAQP